MSPVIGGKKKAAGGRLSKSSMRKLGYQQLGHAALAGATEANEVGTASQASYVQ